MTVYFVSEASGNIFLGRMWRPEWSNKLLEQRRRHVNKSFAPGLQNDPLFGVSASSVIKNRYIAMNLNVKQIISTIFLFLFISL